jgi:hypothetical protein
MDRDTAEPRIGPLSNGRHRSGRDPKAESRAEKGRRASEAVPDLNDNADARSVPSGSLPPVPLTHVGLTQVDDQDQEPPRRHPAPHIARQCRRLCA